MLQNPSEMLKEIALDNPVEAKEGVVDVRDPLSLDIPDEDLVHVLEGRIDASKRFFDGTYELSTRRQKNEMFYLGRQIGKNEKASRYRPYEARYQDNAIYEIEASIKPVAMNRMPDLIVLPGNDGPESKESAKNISAIIDSEIKSRSIRRVLGMAFKHLPIYFTGIIKCRWNPELGKDGDYEFEVVHPENIVIDDQCSTNNANDMRFIAQATKMTVQEVVMRFPKKTEEFLTELRRQGVRIKDGDEWKQMGTVIKIWEVWFTWYKKVSETEYERVEGVLWKYGNCILKKMKNPNFDYEGSPVTFTYGEDGEKHEATENEVMAAAVGPMMGLPTPNVATETVYRNYFDMPEKPYYFMGFDQLGKIAYDETSRIEQNIYNQENIDAIGKRVIEKLKDRGKHIFSKESGLTGKDLERMDMNNPDQDILAEGDVNKVHAFMQPPQPTQQEFAELKLARERMFTLAGATNLTGVLQSDVATSNQIAREANYGRVDDLAEDTINAAAEWMARWSLQMIKLRYTEEHMRKVLGSKGSLTFIRLKHDMVEDGMEVKIKASGSDKVKRRNTAMDMAKLRLIDPLTFFEDLDLNDPVGRTERLMLSMTDPAGYLMRFVMGKTTEEAAMMLQQGMGQQMPQMGANPVPANGGEKGPYVNPVETNPQQPVPGATSQEAMTPPTGIPGVA